MTDTILTDQSVKEHESPLGPIAFLHDEKQATTWIAAQDDCTIDWRAMGWYAPEFTDEEGAHYRLVEDVLTDVTRRLTELRAYETALRAVPAKPST